MSIVRAARPDSDFTIVRNEVLRDGRLSYRARGLLAAVLSRPDNWRTSADSLARESKEGRAAILTGLRELRDAGYIRTVRERRDRGRFVTVTYVYDEPVADPQTAVETVDNPAVQPEFGFRTPVDGVDAKAQVAPEVDSPKSDNPESGKPASGNRTPIEEREEELPPIPPASGGRRACRRHSRPRSGCADCAKVIPPLLPWCGDCDPNGETDPAARMVTITRATGEAVAPCPRCHPSTPQPLTDVEVAL